MLLRGPLETESDIYRKSSLESDCTERPKKELEMCCTLAPFSGIINEVLQQEMEE